jgi:RHS repeat-associated protein
VVQHIEYVPFGELFLEEKNAKWNTPYLFTGKELDRETGLSYFGARYYDSKVSLWISVDVMAEKYPSISPYAYVANNPINAIDPDGKDIIVLAHGGRNATSIDGGKTNASPHYVGHQAVLIGNDKTGWRYISYDYDEGVNNGRGKSGKNDKYTETTFKTLSDFKNSEHNSYKDDYDDGKGLATSHRDAKGNIIQRYDNAFRIETDVATDNKMINAATNVLKKPWAEISSLGQANQCTTVAEKALDAGSLNNGERTPQFQIGRVIFSTKNYLPAAKLEAIEKRNTGTDADASIKRTDNK